MQKMFGKQQQPQRGEEEEAESMEYGKGSKQESEYGKGGRQAKRE